MSGRLNGEWMEYERETKEKTHDHYFILQGPYLDREKVIQWGKKTLQIIKNNFKIICLVSECAHGYACNGGICPGQGL